MLIYKYNSRKLLKKFRKTKGVVLKMKTTNASKKKFFAGLAVSIVLAMAIGSFALGEVQMPTAPQATQPQVAATNGTDDFNVTGDGTEGQNNDYHYDNGLLYIHPISSDTNIIISNQGSTSSAIKVTKAATITLNGVNIVSGTGPSLEIEANADFDVKIILADGSENILDSSNAGTGGRAGLEKTNDNTITNPGKLTITGAGTLKATGGQFGAGIGGDNCLNNNYGNASNIEIIGTNVEATGGDGAAGIGGGLGGNGSQITISNSNITATGGAEISLAGYVVTSAAAIGGGGGALQDGTWVANIGAGGNNKLNDSSILIAKGGSDGDYPKNVLEGFDEDSDQGIAFIQKTDSEVNEGTVYGDTVLKNDFAMPKNATLTIPQNKSLTINASKTLKVPDGAVLTNDGTLTIKGTLSCTDTGKVETLLNYDFQGGDIVEANDDSYITYQDASGAKKYENLPEATKEGCDFDGWYTKEKGQGTNVENGNDILLNEHTLYANWIAEPEPTPTPPTPTPPGPEPTPTPPGPEPGPEPTPEPTPDPSVDPDGGDGSGSSSKTSDPFMGGIALALLGVATTGAVLVRKRK